MGYRPGEVPVRNDVTSATRMIWAAIGPVLMFLVLGAVYVIGMSVLTLSDLFRAFTRGTASAWPGRRSA